ncbi:MAG TPA: TauD/TfdA family dioxygenase [Burkholderiales bacterium]|nr:TauD/TfdA family dioxygenase [Burkholderiales bacterium]
MASAAMEVRPIAGMLGAEVLGIDLRGGGDDATWAALQRVFLDNHVVAVRSQQLSLDDMMAVGRRFGEPNEYPFVKGIEGYPFIHDIVKEPAETRNFGSDWHSDTTYLPRPPSVTLLYALQTPARGGDTLYANTRAAYEALSDAMKRMLGGLIGVNGAGLKRKPGGGRAARDANFYSAMKLQNGGRADALEAKHPAVRTHPQTGRKSLYVSTLHTTRFDGMTEAESQPLIDWLNDHCIKPEFTCRVRWEPGTLTFWDNRCVLHNAINDYPGERRHMRRLTVAPEVPV